MLSSVSFQRQARSEFYETFKANLELGRRTQNVGVTGILFLSKIDILTIAHLLGTRLRSELKKKDYEKNDCNIFRQWPDNGKVTLKNVKCDSCDTIMPDIIYI